MIRTLVFLLSAICIFSSGLAKEELWPGFVDSGYNGEQVREIRFAEDARAIVVAPAVNKFDPERPTLLVIYATPNGNTAEQTLGCQLTEGMDWHFDIQHAAAQWRVFRELEKDRNSVLACVQADALSWPGWKEVRPTGPQQIRQIVESLAAMTPGKDVRIVLTGHSGGGSFLFGYLDAVDEIPSVIERIAFLDANYGYDNDQHHGEKLLKWLAAEDSHTFVTLAYDDRNIELDGKKVVGPTGGTFRATHRMLDFLEDEIPLKKDQQGEFDRFVGVNGQLTALVHPNPKNIILHTRLVGEMNGLLEVLTLGTPYHEKWGKLESTRAYTALIQPTPYVPSTWHAIAPALPDRKADFPNGSIVIKSLLTTEQTVREAAISREIRRGNVPQFWRKFVSVSAESRDTDGQTHNIVYRVSPDYLSVGSDEDFVRIPLAPYIAQHIADILGCVLPTRKMVDDIYTHAEAKLVPEPLTDDRESLASFLEHHQLIQTQLQNQPARFVAGIKKDVVVTKDLAKHPEHVAIYGWHKLDGKPIQPLTTVRVDWYVDYSHGIRMVDRWAEVDGKPMLVREVLRDKNLCGLLSDEGLLHAASYHSQLVKPTQ
jgi:hypothetical protein